MIYPNNFEQKVGFQEIRKMLKGRCLSSLGAEEVDRMVLLTNPQTIALRMTLIRELRAALKDETTDFPSEGFVDMRPSLIRTQVRGTYMDETELFTLMLSLRSVGALCEFLSQKQGESETVRYPHLWEMAEDVACFPEITERISRCLNEYGKMKDDASPDLQRIRTELQGLRKNLTLSVQSILSSLRREGAVEKDAAPTFRDGRPVIPIDPAMKRKLPGIVHDRSASGKTLYVEPAAVVEMDNRIRSLELEERQAIIRILTEVADFIRPQADDVMQSYRFLGKIDFIRACVLLSEALGATEPQLVTHPMMDFRDAIHPLLQQSLSRHRGRMTPLSIKLDGNCRMLLISGPNAGGKSVCLKTAGLLQYMLQCGLSIPVAEGSSAGVFGSMFIDIGDEQSIENDLSTYSSHLLHLRDMMKHTNKDSLILIDEFGSGTEPQIGAALAQAVLARLLDGGAMGIITTHYQNLKYFAESHEGISNGAMLYDRDRMQPLFQLQVGHAGSSFAIEIARKTGLPEEVIRQAQEAVGSDYIQSDRYVQDIVRDKRYWENKRQKVHQQEKRLEELISRYEDSVKELERQRGEVIHQAKAQAEDLLQSSRAQIENTIRSIREAQAEKEQTKKLRRELEDFQQTLQTTQAAELEEKISRKMMQIKARRERREKQGKAPQPTVTKPSNPKKEAVEHQFAEGDYVRIDGQAAVARILKVDNREALLQSGTMQIRVSRSRLRPAEAPRQQEEERTFSFMGKQTRDDIYEKKLNFRSDIDVRGMNGEEAIRAVTYFIDDAVLLGVSRVRILHGTGTGYLRRIIRQYLTAHPSIVRCADEHVQFGGAGITVVDFR